MKSYRGLETSVPAATLPGAQISAFAIAEMPLSVLYMDTFWKATGVPLLLVPVDPAERFLCLPPPHSGQGGSPRHQLLWELGRRTKAGYVSSACSPLELLAVPVRAGGRHVATLLGGPVVCRKPRREEFGRFCRRLAALGITNRLAPSEAEFLDMPVFSNGRLEAVRGLLGRIAQHIGEHVCRLPDGAIGDEPEYVIGAKRFIHAHFTEDIGLEKVSRAVGLSTFHLCRIFHQATGSKFRTYLTSVRVDYAKELLSESNLSIERIAYASGFQSHCRFDVVFRKSTGRSPGQYRETIRAQASHAR